MNLNVTRFSSLLGSSANDVNQYQLQNRSRQHSIVKITMNKSDLDKVRPIANEMKKKQEQFK
jgi:hypothetical protein